jgi:hypothetical protein
MFVVVVGHQERQRNDGRRHGRGHEGKLVCKLFVFKEFVILTNTFFLCF